MTFWREGWGAQEVIVTGNDYYLWSLVGEDFRRGWRVKGRGRTAGYVEMRTTTVKWGRRLLHALYRCGGGMGACIEDGKSSGGDGA